jgi:hypothetical protein
MSKTESKIGEGVAQIKESQDEKTYFEVVIAGTGDFTFEDFRASKFYLSDEFIPKKFIDAGYTHATSSISFSEFSESKGGEEKADGEKEKERADGGKEDVEPAKKAEPKDVVKDEEGASTETMKELVIPKVPAIIGEFDPKVAQIPAINLTGTLNVPKFTRAFWSGVKFHQSELNHDLLWYLEYGKINATTERDTRVSIADAVREWCEQKTFGMFGKFPHSEEPMFREADATEPSAMGFPVHEAVKSLMHPDAIRSARMFLRRITDHTLAPNPNNRRNRVKRFAALTDDEKMFQITADGITRRRLGEVRDLHSFMAPMRDMFRTLRPLPVFDTSLRKCYMPDEMKAWGEFMDRNSTLRNTQWDILENIVATRIPLMIEAKSTTFDELTKVISAKNDTANEVDQYPTKLNKRSADSVGLALFTSFLGSRYGRLSMPHIVLDDISLSTLMDCICAKILLAHDRVHSRTIVNVDNYIAKHIVPGLPGYNAANETYDDVLAETGAVNYLERGYANGVLNRGLQSSILFYTFVRTTQNGAGWSDAGASTIHPVPAAAARFLQPRAYWYRSPTGRDLRRGDVPVQFENFVKWVTSLRKIRLTVSSPHDRVGETVLKLLRWLATKRHEFAETMFFAQRVVKLFSYNPIVYPSHTYHESEIAEITIPTNGCFSFLAFSNFSGTTPLDPPIDLIHAGWKMHEDFNSFVFYYHLYKSYMTDQVFSRKDWVKKALDYAHSESGFKSYLERRLVTDNELLSVDMPDANFITVDWNDRRQLVQTFINKHISAFGVYKSVYFYPNAPFGAIGPIQRYLQPKGKPDKVFNFTQIQDLIATERYTQVLQAARAAGEMIEFQVPVNYSRQHVLNWANRGSIVQLPTSSAVFSLGDVVFDFTWEEYVIDDNSAEYAEQLNSNWILPFIPYTIANENYILTLFDHVEMDKFEVEIVTDLPFDATY